MEVETAACCRPFRRLLHKKPTVAHRPSVLVATETLRPQDSHPLNGDWTEGMERVCEWRRDFAAAPPPAIIYLTPRSVAKLAASRATVTELSLWRQSVSWRPPGVTRPGAFGSLQCLKHTSERFRPETAPHSPPLKRRAGWVGRKKQSNY